MRRRTTALLLLYYSTNTAKMQAFQPAFLNSHLIFKFISIIFFSHTQRTEIRKNELQVGLRYDDPDSDDMTNIHPEPHGKKLQHFWVFRFVKPPHEISRRNPAYSDRRNTEVRSYNDYRKSKRLTVSTSR